jgi:hypothetical protein
MILIFYLIIFLFRWVDDPNWTNKRPEDINNYGFVVLIAVALESLVALAVVIRRQKSLPQEKQTDGKTSSSNYYSKVVAVGVLELIVSTLFVTAVTTGLDRIIPISPMLCAPIWLASTVFGSLLCFSKIIHKTWVLCSYLIFSVLFS